MNIVYLEPPDLKQGFRKLVQNYLRKVDIPLIDVKFVCLTQGCLRKKTKTKWEAINEKEPEFRKNLSGLQPDFIICNDKAALNYITGKYLSLALCRGGVYNWNGIPCIVINDLKATKTSKTGAWNLLQDLGKTKRWITGKLREEPKFEYTVCHEVFEIRNLLAVAQDALAITVDIETTGVIISSVQYTCLWYNTHTSKWAFHTWVIPFVNSQKPDRCHWEFAEQEIEVWNLIEKINDSPAIKILQNGSYDAAYFLKYRVPLRNYIGDTYHMIHCIWAEAFKRIDYIASIAMDTYQYWKDEGKEDEKEDKNDYAIPLTAEGMENYWRYGALDTHNTFLCFRFLIAIMCKEGLQWTLVNYQTEFSQQMGPAFAMTMRGVKCNMSLQKKFAMELQHESDLARNELEIFTGDPEFNPKSPPQVKQMLYDILKAEPYGRGKQRGSTDEKVLKMMIGKNPMVDWFINKLWECKKPANNVSKYGSGVTLYGRYMSKSTTGVTDTGRYSSKAHDFWLGNNIQNMPYLIRVMIEADEGYVLFDIDYAQSDAYFTAFETQDEKFIFNILSEDDVHCKHCEFFFKIAYDKLVAAHKKKEDWTSHNVTGVRSITKRIGYGANYLMRGATLLLTMSREPVLAAAKHLGIKNVGKLTDKQLVKLCDAFLKKYFQMYPRIMEWLDEAIVQAKQLGNVARCAFGRTRIFFGNLDENKTQREFAAYFGQGGTAGNINKAIENIYYGMSEEEKTKRYMKTSVGTLEQQGVMLLFQVHDSLIGQVPIDKLWLIEEVEKAMQNPCTIHGRTFTVPTEVQVGLGWGKRMMNWNANTTIEMIKTNDKTWWEKQNVA